MFSSTEYAFSQVEKHYVFTLWKKLSESFKSLSSNHLWVLNDVMHVYVQNSLCWKSHRRYKIKRTIINWKKEFYRKVTPCLQPIKINIIKMKYCLVLRMKVLHFDSQFWDGWIHSWLIPKQGSWAEWKSRAEIADGMVVRSREIKGGGWRYTFQTTAPVTHFLLPSFTSQLHT